MIDRYTIDFPKTFGGALLLGVEPKMQRADKNDPKSEQVQAHDKEGVRKWTVTLAVQTKSFDTTKFETIPITVTSPTKPCEGLQPGMPVMVEGMELGIMPNQKAGFSVFYSAEAVRPLSSASSAQLGQAARMPSGQPLQSARPTSGQ